ncbi:VOC family protein [Streptacidiphilus sp. PB12-B1b]|uniref:VOC family protein n=1 Tax=Streptacidiphilus sp. PB12-B1b TaxID=2705012 RepID=UPI0015F7A302|nr:VOC family protein [Streptacidiphilus sp. PB12-B1b]QMU75740.1 VOC family protein [Streptacidiphilus sp. PB12-B1b]
MIDHLSVHVTDLAASAAFYDAVLTPLGARRLRDSGDVIGYGDDRPAFWIGAAQTPGAARETHLAFAAASRSAVRAFHDAALRVGATVLHPPGLRPEYHEHYYAAYVRAPDGHNVEAVCRLPG